MFEMATVTFLAKFKSFTKIYLKTSFFLQSKNKMLLMNTGSCQDGATPHRTKDVFETLFNCFNTPVIGLNYPKFAKGGLEWPPYSPDLNPLDFFFWGYLKDKVYKNNPRTLSELKNAIIVEINNIEVQVLQCVIQNFVKDLNFAKKVTVAISNIFIFKCECLVNKSDIRLKNKTYHNKKL